MTELGFVRSTLLSATGQKTIPDAVSWIANRLELQAGADPHDVLRALVALNEPGGEAAKAIQVLTRHVTKSELDSAAVLFRPESITPASRFRAALSVLVHYCPEQSLERITPGAVVSAQRDDNFVIQTLCMVAGLSYGDVFERVAGLPSDPAGPWAPDPIRMAFAVIDAVVTGGVSSPLPNAVPTRPLDLMRSVVGVRQETGWALVARQAFEGVPYEVLLAQRMAGGTWLAHRNLTSGLLNHSIADELCAALDAQSITYRRSSLVGGTVPPRVIQEQARSDKQVGVVVIDRRGHGLYGIVFASARDSGTASKSAARLRTMRRDPDLPMAVVVSGPGWAARNETADLAVAFGGRIYSEKGLAALVRDIGRGIVRT